ncbi:MAG: FmdB family transcriptional regulator [Planctomycetaceae bacterium]|nr:FmdB family transcriptional regulator [Planctomycetaceae bacterium]
MPMYVYEVVREDGQPGERFELLQRMTDDALTTHPKTGEPVRRVISAPNILGSFSDLSMNRAVADDSKLDKQGFTKYVKAGNGFYEKRAGKGPDVIHKDGPLSPGDF